MSWLLILVFTASSLSVEIQGSQIDCEKAANEVTNKFDGAMGFCIEQHTGKVVLPKIEDNQSGGTDNE